MSWFRASIIVVAFTFGPWSVRAEPAGRIEGLEFLSSPIALRAANDLDQVGDPYPRKAWQADPPVNCPVMQVTGHSSRMGVRINLTVQGITTGTPFEIVGESTHPALCFRAEGKAADHWVIDLKATRPVGVHIRKLRSAIVWSLILNPGTPTTQKVDLGKTGPHTVYVVPGRPRTSDDPLTAVTAPRLEWVIAELADAQKEAGLTASTPKLVHELVKIHGRCYVGARHFDRKDAWRLPDSWELDPPGASCVSIVEHLKLVCDMAGLGDQVRVARYFAREDRPETAREGGLGEPPIYKTAANGERWQLFLVEEMNSARGQVGGWGAVNYYEATLVLEHEGRRWYYPGGSDRAYDSPDQVLKIFRTLAWTRYDPFFQNWVVTEVVHTYVPPDGKAPANAALP
jgi:hypothetical protein